MTTTENSLTTCPVCASPVTEPFISFDQVPVLFNVLWPDRNGAINAPRGDIQLCFCPVCGHVFNRSYDPGRMEYTQDYENSLHFSARFQQYALDLASSLVKKYQLKGKKIIEIGAGQGDFLHMLCELGGNTGVGFDPSYIPEQHEEKEGISFVQDYYSEKYAHYPADFICCRQVLEHIHQPAQFMQMLRRVIGDRHEIVVFFEVPNVEFTIYNLGIWDILYEHFSYFSRPSMRYLFTSSGFKLHQVTATFGDQFLALEAQPAQSADSQPVVDTGELQKLAQEVKWFAENYRQKVRDWQQRLDQIRAAGKKAVVWGAGTKGISFLNNLNTTGAIDYVIDINPRKHGMHITGTGQEIAPPEILQQVRPDYVIIMNANYKDEIEQTIQKMGVSSEVMTA